jgi:hypothetical protein
MMGNIMRAIVDTNVIVVANGNRSPQASLDCVRQCILKLQGLQSTGKIIIDDNWHILREYGRQLKPCPRDQPPVGDAFYKWVLTNRTNPARCEQHPITPHDERGFCEFPADSALANFDRSDRKFAALASVAKAPVWIAVERGWRVHQAALQAQGLEIEFICTDIVSKHHDH